MSAVLPRCSRIQPRILNFYERQKPTYQEKVYFLQSVKGIKCHLGKMRAHNNYVRALAASRDTQLSSSHVDLVDSLPLVKMCGITSPRDAALAAKVNLIGMIIWPNSKRSVSLTVAKEIAEVAREYGADPVGVFVVDDVQTILEASEVLDLEYMQLHGNISRAGFPILRQHGRTFYVLHADENGELLNQITDEESYMANWILVDSKTRGSGKGFTWENFKLPSIRSKYGWLLAGEINSENICVAIGTLRHNGADVSIGNEVLME